jgi:hypothetical protein
VVAAAVERFEANGGLLSGIDGHRLKASSAEAAGALVEARLTLPRYKG